MSANGGPLSPLHATNGAHRPGLVPTNNVSTGEGVTVRARIDPTLTVDDVVKQLCVNLKIKGVSTDYALRDETDELVTNDNLRKKIKTKVNLKCAPSSYPNAFIVHHMDQTRRFSLKRSQGNYRQAQNA